MRRRRRRRSNNNSKFPRTLPWHAPHFSLLEKYGAPPRSHRARPRARTAPRPRPSSSKIFFAFVNFFLFFFLLRNIRRKHACCVATRCAKPRCAHAVLHHAAECVREQSSAQRALARVQHGSASCRAAPEEESPLNTSLTTFLQS
jgi:hypothetical protein